MPTLPFPLIGPTYTNRSLPVASQVTRNFYVEVNPMGTEVSSFMPFPGLKPFATTGSGVNRGTGLYDGRLYTVTDDKLYRVNANGSSSVIGTVGGATRCSFADDGINLVIANGVGKPYAYDGSSLVQGTNVNLPNASTVAYINRRVVYDGAGADVVFADLDDPLEVDSLNLIKADAKADATIAVHAHRQQLDVFGEDSIQPMYNTGTGNPPFDFILNSVQEIGLGAIHSIASNKNYVYFIGSDRQIYRKTGLDLQSISNPA